MMVAHTKLVKYNFVAALMWFIIAFIAALGTYRIETIDIILWFRHQPLMCFILDLITIKVFFLFISLLCVWERFFSLAYSFCKLLFLAMLLFMNLYTFSYFCWHTFVAIVSSFLSCFLFWISFCIYFFYVSSWCVLAGRVVSTAWFSVKVFMINVFAKF